MNNPCGCKISGLRYSNNLEAMHGTRPKISYCAMHLNAHAMLEALKDLYEACSTDVPKDLTEAISARVEAAILAAEGKTDDGR